MRERLVIGTIFFLAAKSQTQIHCITCSLLIFCFAYVVYLFCKPKPILVRVWCLNFLINITEPVFLKQTCYKVQIKLFAGIFHTFHISHISWITSLKTPKSRPLPSDTQEPNNSLAFLAGVGLWGKFTFCASPFLEVLKFGFPFFLSLPGGW